MKKKLLYSLIGLSVLGGTISLSSGVAHAAILYEQSDISQSQSAPGFDPLISPVPFSVSGITDVYIYASHTGSVVGGSYAMYLQASGCSDGSKIIAAFDGSVPGAGAADGTPHVIHSTVSSFNSSAIGCTGYKLFADNNTNGWVIYGNATDPFLVLADSPTYVNPVATDLSSRIESFSPENASTTASTTINISATIFNISSYTSVNFHILNIDCDPSTETCPDATTDFSLPITSSGEQTVSQTETFMPGQHMMFITMEPRTGTDEASTTSESVFIAFTANPQITYNPADIFASTTSSLVSSCSNSQNTIIYILCRVFNPSAQTWQGLTNLGGLLQAKAPIGYFNQIQQALTGVNTTSSSTIGAFAVIPAGLLGNFFTPIRTGIAGILWFFFLVEFFHRMRNIHI